MNATPTLIIIQGFLGAGKTTFSKKLAKDEGYIRLNADEWCFENFLTEQLETDWDRCFANATEVLWEQTKALLAEGKSVILDIAFWDQASRQHARSMAQKAKASFQHYYIYAPDDVLIERLKQREGAIAQSNIENFAKLKQQFEEPQPHEKAIKINNF